MLQRIDFGRIARSLLRSGYTTKSLGEAIGLSQPSVSRLATQRTRDVSGQVAVDLIRIAGGTVIVPECEEQSAAASATAQQ